MDVWAKLDLATINSLKNSLTLIWTLFCLSTALWRTTTRGHKTPLNCKHVDESAFLQFMLIKHLDRINRYLQLRYLHNIFHFRHVLSCYAQCIYSTQTCRLFTSEHLACARRVLPVASTDLIIWPLFQTSTANNTQEKRDGAGFPPWGGTNSRSEARVTHSGNPYTCHSATQL